MNKDEIEREALARMRYRRSLAADIVARLALEDDKEAFLYQILVFVPDEQLDQLKAVVKY